MKKSWFTIPLCSVCCFFGSQLNADDNDSQLQHECTSWMVFSDLTKNNTNILHKNRDSKSRNIAVTLSPANSPRKWVAQGSGTSTNMAISASGLAGVMNSGEKCINFSTNDKGKSTPAILRVIIDSCDTAAQAVDKLRDIMKAGDYSHGEKGSIFFFCDINEGYVCEVTAKDFSVMRYDKGYTIRANIWQNPGMQQLSRNSLSAYLNSANRMYVAMSQLNQALDKNGKITLPDIFALSRHHKMPDNAADKRSVCFKNTNSTSSLEIDRQYPDVLSTAYFTVGHPLHTIYVPVPVCTEKLYPGMSDQRWSEAAFARFEKYGLQDIPAEWEKFEKDCMAKYSSVKAEARKLLDDGKRKEAVKLLNDTAYAIWSETAKLLNVQ